MNIIYNEHSKVDEMLVTIVGFDDGAVSASFADCNSAWRVSLTPDQAKAIALRITEAATAAEEAAKSIEAADWYAEMERGRRIAETL